MTWLISSERKKERKRYQDELSACLKLTDTALDAKKFILTPFSPSS
jgi:hypothetical protein